MYNFPIQFKWFFPIKDKLSVKLITKNDMALNKNEVQKLQSPQNQNGFTITEHVNIFAHTKNEFSLNTNTHIEKAFPHSLTPFTHSAP